MSTTPTPNTDSSFPPGSVPVLTPIGSTPDGLSTASLNTSSLNPGPLGTGSLGAGEPASDSSVAPGAGGPPTGIPPLSWALSHPQTKPRGMLAWWVGGPLLFFLLVEIAIGWSTISAQGALQPEQVSYLVGKIVGGLLASLAIGWVVYRCSGRSQMAASIAVSLILLVASVDLLGRAAVHEAQHLSQSLVQAKEAGLSQALSGIEHQTGLNFEMRTRGSEGLPPEAVSPELTSHVYSFGPFRCLIPGGWQRVSTNDRHVVAMLEKQDDEGNAHAVIKVESVAPRQGTLFQIAQQLAGPEGEVLKPPVQISGFEGLRIQTNSSDLTRPRYAVLVQRFGKLYLFSAATQGVDIGPPFAQVLTSVAWEFDHGPTEEF